MYQPDIDRYLLGIDWRKSDIARAIRGQKMFCVVCFRNRAPKHLYHLGKHLRLPRRPSLKKRNSLFQIYSQEGALGGL